MTQAFIVVDLGFGDGGKGTTVDSLCRRLPSGTTVVRFNGGCQAAHNVVTSDNKHHTFSQFGSGMFVPFTRTHLSRFMLINPLNMFTEADHLESVGIRDPWGRTSVDPRALIITPYHKALNRLRELSRAEEKRHGSCGQGIGETVFHSKVNPDGALRAGQLRDKGTMRYLLPQIKEWCIEEVRYLTLPGNSVVQSELDQMLLCDETRLVYSYEAWADRVAFMEDNRLGDEPAFHLGCPLVFEGAQGILLDEVHGFHPHTTWSTCTTKNALTILGELEDDYNVIRLGVTRTYMTRHGAGPFPSEDERMTKMMYEPHNDYGAWQGGWRCGFLDIPHLQYSIEVTDGIDGLVITHMDKVPTNGLPVVFDYAQDDEGETWATSRRITPAEFPSVLASELGVGIYMTSWGPTADDKKVGEMVMQ